MEKRGGISRGEVGAVVVMFVVLGLAMLPAIGADNGGMGRARELSNRTYCAANLRGISQAMNVYGADNDDLYPVATATSATDYEVIGKAEEGKATAPDTWSAIYSDKLQANNPLECLWVLVLKNEVTPRQFICKSDPFAGQAAELQAKESKNFYTNFQDGKNVSYSIAYPWSVDKQGKVVVGGQWKNTTDSSLPIVSDMAPYMSSAARPGEMATRAPGTQPATQEANVVVMGHGDIDPDAAHRNSMNHQFQGENVAFGDAHAEFVRRPDVGQNNDNIWTESVENKETVIDAGMLPAALTADSAPFDIVMVPTRSAKGDLK